MGSFFSDILNPLTGASDAASDESAAAEAAIAAEQNMYNETRQDMAPYRQAGYGALSNLTNEMPELTKQFTLSDFQADPGYQFNLQQGQQALQRSAAARGLLNSTNTMASLANYSQGLASNEFNNAYNRFTGNQQQRYNMLSGVANMGLGANNTTATAGMNTANNIASEENSIGNAKAAADTSGFNTLMSIGNMGAQAAIAYEGLGAKRPNNTSNPN